VKHRAVLELRLTHGFYPDGRCPDLGIAATDETVALLQNHRCLLRPSADGVLIFMPFDDAGQPFLALPASATLRFQLTLQNDDFALFTDLAALGAQSAFGAPIFTSVGSSGGALVLASSAVPNPPGVLAGVDIHLDGLALGGPVPAAFRVAFQARRARWAYYCVTDLAPNGGDLHVVDAPPAGTTDVVLFGDQNRTELGAEPDPADPIAVQLAGQYPTMRRVRFLSDQAVACSATPRKHLELRRGVERVASPLPNPSLRHASTADRLFQIIRYQTNPYQF
jgi:hypothetical protein